MQRRPSFDCPVLVLAVLLAIGCSRNSDHIDGPDPSIGTAEPDLVCTAQQQRQVVLAGDGFAPLLVDAASGDAAVVLPEVGLLRSADLDGEATSGDQELVLAADRVSWQSQQSLTLELGPEQALAPGVHRVRVTNGSGREVTLDAGLVVVPPPVLDGVSPDLVCLEQGAIELRLSGEGFLEIEGQLPEVSLGETRLQADRLEDCSPLPATSLEARRCRSLVLTLGQDALVPGAYDLTVSNPAPGDCVSSEPVQLAVVPGPEVAQAAPELLCAEQQAVEVTLGGSGFLDVDGALPQVAIGDASYPALSLADCSPVTGTLLTVQTCNELVFELPAAAHPPGWTGLRVINPPPADCEHALDAALYLAPAPAIARVAPATPCDRDPEQLVITGTDFLELDSQGPSVTVAGVEADLDGLDGCTAVDGLSGGGQARLCTGLTVSVPAGTVTPDAYTVVVRNPGPGACEAAHDSSIGFPPLVSGVDPPQLCSSGGSISVTGDGFADGAVVRIENADHQADLPTTFVDAQNLDAEVPDPTPPGLYDVIVTNPDGCSGRLDQALDITPQPVVYFVDPYTAYNGIRLQVVIYTSGILGQVTEVLLYPTGQPADAVALDFTYDQDQRVQAIVPAGLAPGSYGVRVTDELGCSGALDDALQVVEQLGLALDHIELPFGWTNGQTGVNVYAPADPGPGLVNFAPTPRLFLNPADAGPDSLASELRSTAYVSPTRVSAVVPAGLPVGLYDLVAVNPDGTIGLLADAFEVTAEPPPVITELAPSSLVNQDLRTLIILGDNFRQPSFSADCLQPDDSHMQLAGTVETWDATSIEVSIDFVSQTVADGSICVVRVTNDDGTYADYSALGVTNPSLNLESFSATGLLNTARRAPCAARGEPVAGARFVYAIGGDDGTTQDSTATSYHASMEMAAVDPFGELSPWTVMPYALPQPRSFLACATVDGFVYALGGNGGAGATATVWRAMVLRPEGAPIIEDIDLVLDPEQAMAFTPGRYSYRVAAVMAADDAENPDGETLASDAVLVQVPDIAERVSIGLHWSEMPGAVRYRVYRTAAAGDPSGTEQLLAEVDAPDRSLVDDGTQAVAGDGPLPLGALGRFAEQPALNTPREGAALATAVDPADPSLVHLYALGGRDDSGSATASLEQLEVQLLADGGQQVTGTWETGAVDIGQPRWQLGAFIADDLSASGIMPAGETWIYAGGGVTADPAILEPDMVALRVEPGGALGEGAGGRWDVGTMQPFRAGYAAMLFNDQLFAFGGTNAMPVSEGSSVEMCLDASGSCGGGPPEPPDLMNWNNLGLDMTVSRYLTSSVTVSAFIFLVGGVDETWTPLAATEKTLW